jgi:hypothetical protein
VEDDRGETAPGGNAVNPNLVPQGNPDTPGTKHNVHPESDAKPGPPDAAQTNYVHPTSAGDPALATVPGAGVVRPTSDAGPVQTDPDRGYGRPFPGHDHSDRGTLASPNAGRPGTTDAGDGARVARGATGPGLGGETEANASTIHANLSVPTGPGGTGAPQPGSSGVPATSDPNFPANHQKGGISEERGNDAPTSDR